jgi:hypothetical protein
MSAGKEVVKEKKARDFVLAAHPLRGAAKGKSKKKNNHSNQAASPYHLITSSSSLNPNQPSHSSKNYPKLAVPEMGNFTHFWYG